MTKSNTENKMQFGLFEIVLFVLPIFFIVADFSIVTIYGYNLDWIMLGSRYAMYLSVWIIVAQLIKNSDDATRIRKSYVNAMSHTSQSSSRSKS